MKKRDEIITIPSSELIGILNRLDELEIRRQDYAVHQMTLSNAFRDTKSFFDEYYQLHKVPYVKKIKIGKMVLYFKRDIDPYKLPLIPVETDSIFHGTVHQTCIDNKNYFYGIELCETVTEQTSTSYTHELTHVEVNSVPGSLIEEKNSEVLSIFNELLHAALLGTEEKILRLNDSRRIYEMKTIANDLVEHSLDYEELLDCSRYLESTLQAYNLFITYYKGNTQIKREVIKSIQQIFDGYRCVEELLRQYDISFESSIDEKRLKNYFNR